MGQALYRKYRSKSLSELVGQEHVTATLRNALDRGRISHAYLLSGPRGVGKTSIARILAHEINGLPYDDEAHLDIIEIDAASNRRIDEIRELRDRVNTAPAAAKYKVYIIDEVHMLTKEAFNALLKTLEEPPEHVVFILATTEAHKLPETIVSRTQRYNLRPVPLEKVIIHLKHIAKAEKLIVDDDALTLIAQHGEGSFRDSISLFDQASSIDTHVTKAHIENMLGLAPRENIARLQQVIASGGVAATVATLSDLYELGYEPVMLASQLGGIYREQLLTGNTPDAARILELLRRLLDIAAARNPRQLLELILIQSTLSESAGRKTEEETVIAQEPNTSKKLGVDYKSNTHASKPVTKAGSPISPSSTTGVSTLVTDVHNPDNQYSKNANNKPTTIPHVATQNGDEIWQGTLDEIKKQHNTLYGIARMAKAELSEGTLTLSFKFAFHQKRLNEARNRKILADAAEQLYGKPIEIICIVAEPEDDQPKADVSAISNIFGGAELLES